MQTRKLTQLKKKRALQILYKDYESALQALLAQNGSNSIHANNLQKLMIEIFKSMNGLNPPRVWEIQEKKPIKTMNFGLDSISFRSSFVVEHKTRKKLTCFQKRIGKWSGARYTCTICH